MDITVLPTSSNFASDKFTHVILDALSRHTNYHNVERAGDVTRILRSFLDTNMQLKIYCYPTEVAPSRKVQDRFEIHICLNDFADTVYKFIGRAQELGVATGAFLQYVTQFVTIEESVSARARTDALAAVKLMIDAFPAVHLKSALAAANFQVNYDRGVLTLKSKGVFDGPAFDYIFRVGSDWDAILGRLVAWLYSSC